MTTWLDLENIMLSEISQSEKDKHHMISLTCGIRWTKLTKKQNRNRFIDTENKLTVVRGKRGLWLR